jgi:UDP-glucose 4-epimerase
MTARDGEPRRVLITGATGALGASVVRAFAAAGWRIRTLSRHPPHATHDAARHEHVAAEIDDFAAVARAVAGVDAIVHLAALLHVVDPAPELAAEYRRINVGGTDTVVRAARESGVARVVFASSIAVYGRASERVDERAAAVPDTLYGRTKLEAEARILETASGMPPSGCVLRLAAVYGPSIKGNYEQLVYALAGRRFVPIGPGTNRRTLVFEEDAARAMLLSASDERAAGRTFNVTDGSVHTVNDIVAAIAGALDRKPPRVRVPLSMARMAAAGIERACALARVRAPVTRATIEKYVENIEVDGSAIQRDLGFMPRCPLEEGWRRTVRHLREEGRL